MPLGQKGPTFHTTAIVLVSEPPIYENRYQHSIYIFDTVQTTWRPQNPDFPAFTCRQFCTYWKIPIGWMHEMLGALYHSEKSVWSYPLYNALFDALNNIVLLVKKQPSNCGNQKTQKNCCKTNLKILLNENTKQQSWAKPIVRCTPWYVPLLCSNLFWCRLFL